MFLAAVAGKNFIPVARSNQSAASSVDCPFTTSSNPVPAPGDNVRDSFGFLRSQSTNSVLAPVSADHRATAAAVLDLPSFGTDDVNPMILPPATVGLRSMATLMDRMASENAENGESTIVEYISDEVAIALLTPVRRFHIFSDPNLVFLPGRFGFTINLGKVRAEALGEDIEPLSDPGQFDTALAGKFDFVSNAAEIETSSWLG